MKHKLLPLTAQEILKRAYADAAGLSGLRKEKAINTAIERVRKAFPGFFK